MICYPMKSILAAGCAAFALFAALPLSAQGPDDPNEGSTINYNATSGGTTFDWWGRAGMGYFIQQSDDLITWQYVPILELGADTNLSYGFTSTAANLFLRLQVEANPFQTDMSGAGLSDAYHILSGIAPDQGGLTYMQLWLLRHMPSPNAHPPRLPKAGNSPVPFTLGAVNAGGGGAGAQLDAAHAVTASNPAPSAPSLSVGPGFKTDSFGNQVSDYSKPILSWSDNYNSSETSVTIQRRDGTGNWVDLATLQSGSIPSSPSYTDTSGSLLADVSHIYRLQVVYTGGVMMTSNVAQFGVPVLNDVQFRTDIGTLTTTSGKTTLNFAPWSDWSSGYSFGLVERGNVVLYDAVKADYNFALNPSRTEAVTVYEMFIDWGLRTPKVIGSHSIAASPSGGTSSTYTIDPTSQPDIFPKVGTQDTGHRGLYFTFQEAKLSASGNIAENGTQALNLVVLDSAEKQDGSAIVQTYESGICGTFSPVVPNYPFSANSNPPIPNAVSATLTFDGLDSFTVRDQNNNEVTSPTITVDPTDPTLYYTVFAKPGTGDTATFTVSMSVTLATTPNPTPIGSDSVTYTCRKSSTLLAAPTYTIPFSEASGARYRKIALNGRPLSDEKPHETAESDQEKEETYVDALSGGLRHSNTDVYLPIAGSDLPITARRDTISEVWNMRNGLRPHERVDRPFGAGWTSSLCANLEFVTNESGTTTCVVTDQNGATHRYFQVLDATGKAVYAPLPSDRRENGDYLTTFTGKTFTDRYGTTITFDLDTPPITQTILGDRDSIAGSESYSYFRVKQISDRLGNTLLYTYPSNATTLIPSTIKLAADNSQVLSIQQDANGRVINIWDANGNETSYGYDSTTVQYAFGGQVYNECVLASVTTPDGTTGFSYDFLPEADTRPGDVNNGNPTDQYHLDLHSITDPKGNVYTFSYKLDYTRLDYNTTDGYFAEIGAPRVVTGVTLPGNVGNTVFDNTGSLVAIQYDNAGNPSLTNTCNRTLTVTDAMGKHVVYTFGGGQVFNVQGLDFNTPAADVPKVIFYTTMEIDYGKAGTPEYMGSESFTFDPAAGLALASVTDFSGNTTTYTYGDTLAPTSVNSLAFPNGYFGKYPDPTQTLGADGAKSFHYGAYRIMDQVTDENGRVRQYPLTNTGLRMKELVHQTDVNSPVVQETDYTYDNASFPGVATTTTVRQLDNIGWATDLKTKLELYPSGHVKNQIVDPDPGKLQLTTYFEYDPNGNKLLVRDPNQNVTQFDYDGRNRLLDVIYADGSMKSIRYDANGNKHEEIDENTHTTTYDYDVLNRLWKVTRTVATGDIVTQYGYNAVNSKISVTDPRGKITTMDYDDLQRLKSTTDPYVKTTTYHYDGPNSGGSAFDSSSFKPTSIVDPRGYTSVMTYDARYRLVSKNQQYNLSPAAWTLTQYGYDPVGNQTSVIDARQQWTTTEYDALNRPYHVTYADSHDSWIYYTSTGLKWDVMDELGYETQTRYDTAGRPVAVISPQVDDGLNPDDADRSSHLNYPTVQTGYDNNGNIVSVINPLGKEWDYHYDVRNRKTEEDQPSVTDATTGLPARPTIYTGYDYVGNVIWAQDARGYTTQTGYDEANRPTGTIAPPVFVYGQPAAVQPTTGKTYDPAGNVLNVTDANSNTTVNTYDDLNRLSTTTDAQGNKVQYGYDEVGNRTTVKDGKNNVTTLTYDGLNRNTSIKDAHGRATTFTYDGIVKTSQKDVLNQVTDYSYDQRNQLTMKTFGGAPAQSNWRTYVRDAREDLWGVLEFSRYYQYGILQTGNFDVCTVEGLPDPLHRITLEISSGASHTYRLDLAGNRLGTQYGLPNGNAGRQLESTFDALNRLSTVTDITDRAHPQKTSYGYDLNGNVVTKTLPNGEVISMSYDGMNRMFSEKDVSPVLPSGVLYNYLSLCDPAGNLCYSSDSTAGVPGRILILGYDLAERLTSESVYDATGAPQVNTTYGYDAANNRTSKTVTPAGGAAVTTTYTINDLNQLTGWSDTSGNSGSYTYDGNGNRATRVVGGVSDTYSYDFENRLIGLSRATAEGTTTHSYVYDYRGRRVWRQEGVDSWMPDWQWVWSGQPGTYSSFSGGTSVQEYSDPNSTPDVEYIRGSDWGGGVGGILYSIRNGDPLTESFAHYDRRGDVTAHTDGNGALTYQASYEAGGTRSTPEFGSTLDRQKANTKEEDPTGLLNEGMRYRDLETDTFITRDPAGMIDGPNLYCYVGQNPWTKFDPEGLSSAGEPDIDFSAIKKGIDNSISEGISFYHASRSVGDSQARAIFDGFAYGFSRMTGGLGLAESIAGEKMTFDQNDNIQGRKMSGSERFETGFASAVQIAVSTASVAKMSAGRAPTPIGEDPLPVAPGGSLTGKSAQTITIETQTTVANETAAPNNINFSQRTVGSAVENYTADMKSGNWDWSKSGPLRVMEVDGQLVSYDNRRLMAAQNAGLKNVPIQRINPGDVMPGSKRTWSQAFNRRFNDSRNRAAGGPVPARGVPEQPQVQKTGVTTNE